MKAIILCSSIILLCSCKAIMLNHLLKDPKVENTNTIRNFQISNGYSTENSLILKGDTSSAILNLFMGMTVGYYVFNKEGDLVCYNGSSTCHGVQFKQLLENSSDSFKVCKNDSITLEKVLRNAFDLNERDVDINQFAKADYYVVSYWQKFLAGKRGYEDAVTWMEEEISKNKSPLKFTFIKINTDLQENWGFIPNKKAKLILKTNGEGLTIDIVKLPIKRS